MSQIENYKVIRDGRFDYLTGRELVIPNYSVLPSPPLPQGSIIMHNGIIYISNADAWETPTVVTLPPSLQSIANLVD